MEIKGKVHCFFEQSGTFKNEFIKLGIPAEDYDIQNNFGETDHTDDLFKAIEDAYDGKPSLFDRIRGGQEDLIVAFFPCIYFSCLSQMNLSWENRNYRNLSIKEKTDAILQRSNDRERFWRLLVQMYSVAEQRGLRMIIENPYSLNTFLKGNFITPPTIVDENRMLRGDYFIKPTAYWFVNCTPTQGLFTEQNDKKKKEVMRCRKAPKEGICSEERSMISPDYARNFICDFILGKEQQGTQLNLF